MATWNLGELVASTLPAYQQDFEDNVFNKSVYLDHMRQNGGVVKKSGGTSVRVPLMHEEGISEWFGGTDTLDVSHIDTLDAAEYTWRNLNASIVFTFDDEMTNSGEEQVIDLIKAKVMQAEATIANQLNTSALTGTGSETRPAIVGLETAIGVGSYGGIDGSTYSNWRAVVDSNAEALSIADMRSTLNTIQVGKGGSPVSMILTTQTLYEKYESLGTPTYQMNPLVTSKEVQRLMDVGFNALAYAGKPLAFDPAVTTGSMYFFNTKNLSLFVHKDAYFKKTPKVSPTDQHITVQHIVMRVAQGSNRRKSLGALKAKTA